MRPLNYPHCHVPEQVVQLLYLTTDRRDKPQTDIDARFSLPFVVKALLLDGAIAASTFEPEARSRINASEWPLRLTWEPWSASGFAVLPRTSRRHRGGWHANATQSPCFARRA